MNSNNLSSPIVSHVMSSTTAVRRLPSTIDQSMNLIVYI